MIRLFGGLEQVDEEMDRFIRLTVRAAVLFAGCLVVIGWLAAGR